MKVNYYIFFSLICLFTFSSCTEDSPTITPKENNAIELKVVTEYDIDSITKSVYQVDPSTNDRHGSFKQYDENGQVVIERTYKKNLVEGIENLYYSNGQLESTITLTKGKYHGKFKYFFEDGTLKQEGEFINNKIEGLLKTYYSNGILKEEVTLVANMTQGPFKEYNTNGTIKTEGNYNNKEDREELETGELKMYDENGILTKKMICKDGQCCKIWTKKQGKVKPSSDYCASIIQSMQKDSSKNIQ